MELGYARVSTTKQDLDRQIDALTQAGTDRPGLKALLDYARTGDVIVVHTLDRLGRTVRGTLNLVHDLHERGVGVRNLADPIHIDSASPNDPMARLAVVLLALFAEMERTYTIERDAHARAVATAKGRRVGRPSVVSESQLAHADQLRTDGYTIAEITKRTGLTRSTLHRHLPPRDPESLTAAPAAAAEITAQAPSSGRLACPTCGHEPASRAEALQQRDDLAITWLHVDGDRVVEQHHCAGCQPHGDILNATCSRCGDGPLISGQAAELGEHPGPQVLDWLAAHGWNTDPDLLCPDHAR